MARKNYVSQISESTLQFVNKQKESEKKIEVPVEKNITQPIGIKEVEQEKKDVEKTSVMKEEKQEDKPSESIVSTLDPNIDINALLDAKFKEYMLAKSAHDKRRVYEEETTVISIRLEKSIYEYAKKQGSSQGIGMTQYIKNLIKNDMENKKEE